MPDAAGGQLLVHNCPGLHLKRDWNILTHLRKGKYSLSELWLLMRHLSRPVTPSCLIICLVIKEVKFKSEAGAFQQNDNLVWTNERCMFHISVLSCWSIRGEQPPLPVSSYFSSVHMLYTLQSIWHTGTLKPWQKTFNSTVALVWGLCLVHVFNWWDYPSSG